MFKFLLLLLGVACLLSPAGSIELCNTDGQPGLTIEEFAQCFGVSVEDVRKDFEVMDANGDGIVEDAEI